MSELETREVEFPGDLCLNTEKLLARAKMVQGVVDQIEKMVKELIGEDVVLARLDFRYQPFEIIDHPVPYKPLKPSQMIVEFEQD